MKPIFKWTGGKRREIKLFKQFFPDLMQKQYEFIEPFVGGGAVLFNLENNRNIINDYDSDVINFYKQVKEQNPQFLNLINDLRKEILETSLSETFYRWRNKDRSKDYLTTTSLEEQAVRFYVINQLAFSGIKRFNSKNQFNTPFGHYKNLNLDILSKKEHVNLLRNTTICCGDFQPIMSNNDREDVFIFLDPPYNRVFKKYSADNEFDLEDHKRLRDTFTQMSHSKVMLIIDGSEEIKELYEGYIKHEYELNYGVNIKNRFSQKVTHLIITNY